MSAWRRRCRPTKQGADLRLVTSTANTIPITIFTSPSIKTAQDLKGKTIGISTFGSETDVAVSIALQRLGLKRQDVTISQIGGSSQRFAALIAGRIDAAPLLEPTITAAKEKGFNPLLDLAAADTPWIFDGVVVTSSYLKEHRDTLTHFVKAYIAGAYLALSDVQQAKTLIAQKYKTNDPMSSTPRTMISRGSCHSTQRRRLPALTMCLRSFKPSAFLSAARILLTTST